MRINLSKYIPTLAECWIIILGFILIVGPIISLGIAIMLPAMTTNSLVLYIIPLTPALLYIAYKSYKNRDSGISVPINNAYFGDMGIFRTFILSTFALFTLSIIIEPLSYITEMPDYIKELNRAITGKNIYTFLSIVIVAPLVEEFLLRGVIARGLFYHTTPKKGILYSALFFAIIHLNLWQGLAALCMGAFFAILYYKTHSLWLVVYLHFVNNLVSYIYILLGVDPEIKLYNTLSQYGNYTFYLVYFLSTLLFIIIAKELKSNLTKKDLFKEQY